MSDSPVTQEQIQDIHDALLELARELEGIQSDEEGRGPDVESGIRQHLRMKSKKQERDERQEEMITQMLADPNLDPRDRKIFEEDRERKRKLREIEGKK